MKVIPVSDILAKPIFHLIYLINRLTEGMLYITRPQDFPDKRPFPILNWFDAEIEEWGSTQPVFRSRGYASPHRIFHT